MQFQKPHPLEVIGIPRGGRGSSKSKILEGKHEAKLEFPDGGEGTKTNKRTKTNFKFRLIICCCFLLESYQIQLQMFVHRI